MEAMAIAGYDGQTKAYLRTGGIPVALERLGTAIKQARETGVLGRDIFGTRFDLTSLFAWGREPLSAGRKPRS